MLNSWFEQSNISVKIDCFESGKLFIEEAEKGRFDIVIIDMQMNGIDGVHTISQFRRIDMRCLLVFITNNRENVWEAFSFHPFDYLLKPIKREQVGRILTDAICAVPKVEKYLEVSVGRQKLRLIESQVMYALSDNHHSIITMSDGKEFRAYLSFLELTKILQDRGEFVVCNRGIVLNINYIVSLEGNQFVMQDGKMFPIRQRNRSQIRAAFLDR